MQSTMVFKTDKQRKAVMAKLRGRNPKSAVLPIILPLQMISGDVIKKGFPIKGGLPSIAKSRGSRHRTGSVAFSYVTGKKLPGKFSSLKDVFRKFPKEKKAFDKVKRFNKKFNTGITSTRQLRDAERRIEKFTEHGAGSASNRTRNPPKKKKRKVKRFVQSIYG